MEKIEVEIKNKKGEKEPYTIGHRGSPFYDYWGEADLVSIRGIPPEDQKTSASTQLTVSR